MPQNRDMNPRKLAVFKGVTLLMAPLLGLLILEMGLRVFGFGYNTDVFNEKNGLVRSNWSFTFNYFPWSIARPMAPVSFAAEKPEDTLRVFVLGGSAAQGFPEISLGMAAQLQAILEQADSGKTIEVINTAITAANSHVVLPVARACLKYDPDFLVVYLGNNEVVGPHGVGSVFSKFTGSLGWVRFGTTVRSMRFYQLGLLLSGKHKTATGTWKGMEFFLQNTLFEDDEQLRVAYKHFRRNLSDLIRSAEKAKCQVLLSTVGVNLAQNPPFASKEPDFKTPMEKRVWREKYKEAEAQLKGNRFRESAALFKEIADSAPQHAETQYLLGLSYQGQGNTKKAHEAFCKSRDLDGLRFRADDKINSIIRNMPTRINSGSVVLLDTERLLADNHFAAQGTPGNDLFYDHVHLSFRGNFLVAREMGESILSTLNTGESAMPSIGQIVHSLAFSEWDKLQANSMVTNQLLDKPPFTDQWGHSERQVLRRRELRKLADQLTPPIMADFKTLYRNVLGQRPQDTGLKLRYSRFLSNTGDKAEAREILRDIVSDFPGHHQARLELGNLASELSDYEAAKHHLRVLLKENPYAIEVRNAYMRMLYDNGKLKEAESYCRELVADHPADPDIRYVHGLILNSMEKFQEALDQIRVAIAIDSKHSESRRLLQNILRLTGRTAVAMEEAKAWVAADDKSVVAHVTLAEWLSRNNDYESSVQHYQTASKLDPDHVIARSRFVQLKARTGRINEAIAFLKRQLDKDPDILEGYSMLGLILDVAGRRLEALEVYWRGIEKEPDNQKILRELAWILATAKSAEFRNGKKAVTLAGKLVRLAPDEADFRNVLAAAYAENRQFSEAVKESKKGIQLARANGQNDLAKFLEQCLAAYQAGQPIRIN